MPNFNTPKIHALASHCIFFDASHCHDLNTLPLQKKIWALAKHCRDSGDFIDIVPANNNLTLYIQDISKRQYWQQQLADLWLEIRINDFHGNHHKLLTKYGGDHGPDLTAVANLHGISVDDVIQLHSQVNYSVLFLGFKPGFAYLDGLNEQLFTPRHKKPRLSVPKGSVAIGGEQTGVYPAESPGGWQIIGHTDFPLFDIKNSSPCAIEPGDTLEFVIKEVTK